MNDFYRYYESGKHDERERIIKLLSDTYGYCSADDAPEHYDCWGYIEEPIHKIVSVIRGEQD